MTRTKNCDGPSFRFSIPHPFWIGKHEITQGQWLAVMKSNPSEFTGDLELPVERVTLGQASDFCSKVSDRTTTLVRLPTEAEWEYAYQAGSPANVVNSGWWYFKTASKRTHPVGQLLPNEWGLHDMLGNVGEWCSAPMRYPNTLCRMGKVESVWRGGSWSESLVDVVGRTRYLETEPDYSSNDVGFRIVVEDSDDP